MPPNFSASPEIQPGPASDAKFRRQQYSFSSSVFPAGRYGIANQAGVASVGPALTRELNCSLPHAVWLLASPPPEYVELHGG